jgi:integrase
LTAESVGAADDQGSNPAITDGFPGRHRDYGKPKTAAGTRTLGLTSNLIALLTVQTAGKDKDDFVFTGRNGGALRHANFYQRHYRPAVQRLVDEGMWPSDLASLRFHDLRHTCVSLLIENGSHPKEIADWLGHSSIDITMDRYGHLYDGHQDKIVQGLQKRHEDAVEAVAAARGATVIALPSKS